MKKFNKFKQYILNLIYPRNLKCLFCSDELNQDSYNTTCVACLSSLPFIKNYCIRCGSPLNNNQFGVCLRCKQHNFYFTKAISVFSFVDKVVSTIHRFKYSGKRFIIKPITKYLLDRFATSDIFADYVCDVPMFYTKEKLRRYNQSTVLAKEFSKHTQIPFESFCVKIKDTVSQTSLDIKEREQNVKDSFGFKKELASKIKGKSILIVDDVMTTGATINEISKVLIENGAKQCFAITLAHTPIPQISTED